MLRDKLTNLTSHVHEMTPIVVLRLRDMTAIDATGLKAILDFAARAEFHQHVGAENILPNVDAALDRAAALRRAIA